MADPKSQLASAESPWLVRGLIAFVLCVVYGVAQAAGDDLWEFIKSLVQAFTG